MRSGAHVLHVASLVPGMSPGLGCAAATYAAALTVACTLLPEDRPSLARAVAASVLPLEAGRRDLLLDAACSAADAARR